MIPLLIGAGVSALMPLVSEMMREKPDPEAAKLLIESKRQELVDKAVGAGLDRAKAESQVDGEIKNAFAEADRQGQFNFPGGEMVVGAILGGAGGWAVGKGAGMLAKKFPDAAKKLGMGSKAGKDATAEAAASKAGDVDDVAKATAPSPQDLALAQAGGMPLTRGKAVVGKSDQPDVAEMMTGTPFPQARSGGMELTRTKPAAVPKKENVDMASMLAGGPFPG